MSGKAQLKMADVFVDEVVSDSDYLLNKDLGEIANFSGYKKECRYAAHAINSHDDLVLQRDELLAALQGMIDIASDSHGVAGYYLNGDVADWDEFVEWHSACDAIAKVKAVPHKAILAAAPKLGGE